jgi:hypothetical protein
MPQFIHSRIIIIALATLATLAILAGVFQLGVSVGERKSRHFTRWFENYDRNLMPPGSRRPGPNMPPGGMPMPMLPNAHGVFGKILSVSDNSLIIQGKDNVEQNVIITSSTAIRIDRGVGTIQDLKPETEVSVLGAPNEQGQIQARLIRLFNK